MSALKITRILYACLVSTLLVSNAEIIEANAEDLPQDCQASFNVNGAMSITHFGWLPSSDTLVTSMSCGAAEALRENLFINGITDDDLNHALSLPDSIDEAIRKNEEARQSIANASNPSELKTALDGQLLVYSKYSAIDSCLVIRSKGAALICGINWLVTFVAGYDLYQKANPSDADKQRALSALDVDHDSLVKIKTSGDYTKNPLFTAKQILHQAEVGLCQEVRTNCLSR